MGEQLKQVERDLVLFGLIVDYISEHKKTLKDYIPNYDGEKINY